MANWSSVEKVLATIRAGDEVDRVRQENRIKVTNMANCVPPLTPEEAKKVGMKINCNFGSMMILLSHARRQYLSAFWANQYLFRVKMPYAPSAHQSEWEGFVTQEINRPLRNSAAYFRQHQYRWAAVVTHGPGPMIWYDQDGWENDFVAVSDLRIPTDTTTDFRNLGWFGVRHIYTPGGLLVKAFKPHRNNHWAKKSIMDILKNYKEVNFVDATTNYDWETSPEKLVEVVKQNGGFYMGDAMPGIPLWHFYFEDNTDEKSNGWFMVVVPETGTVRGGVSPKEFLWKSDVPVAPRREQILQCQFGDLSIDAPFKYQSVRSLGFALLEPEFYDNLTRCRLLQHVHDNFNIWLRTTDPVDKARAQVQEFSNLGMLRAGVSVVPQNERHQIDAGLVEMAQAQMRQLKQEASSTYTQQLDTGTQKEQTAFETSVKMQQVNAMLGGLLMTAFKDATFEYKEIARRFCLYKTDNADIKLFQKRCKQMGIPRRFLNVDLWDIEPVTPLGMGNPTIAQAASRQLMEIRPAYDPKAQQEILHEATLVITQDPRKAARWAPLDAKKDISNGEEYVQGVFGTLMQGVPVRPADRISPIEQLDALIPMLGAKVQMIMRRNNMGTPDEIMGLQTVGQYAASLVQRLEEDPEEKQRVKQYMDAIGNIFNEVKGLAQRGQEAMQKAMQQQGGNGGPDPKDMAKAQSMMMMAKIKAKTTTDKAKLSERLKSEQHVREQRRQDANAFAEIQRTDEKTKANNRMASFKEE